MATASDYMTRKHNVPSELRSKEWKDVQAQIRERAFFMASVANAKELHKWRSVMEQVTSGAMSPGQAREEMRRYLEKIGYSPDPGLAGTIKDRSTVQRMKVSIDTNVAMARGWAARNEALDDGYHSLGRRRDQKKLGREMGTSSPRRQLERCSPQWADDCAGDFAHLAQAIPLRYSLSSF